MKGYLYWVHLPHHNIKTDGYVGVTKNTKTRWYKHKQDLACKHFAHAILKYHKELIWEIVFEGPLEGCYQLENYFRPKRNIGWNIAIGGEHACLTGRVVSDEEKKKISNRMKGATPWWVTKELVHSEALNLKGRIQTTKDKGTFSGKNNPMYGKTHTAEAKAKISKAHKGKKGMKGKDNPSARKVRCIDTGEIFNTISEAAIFAQCTVQNISLCLRGRGKTAKGYSWEYLKE